MWIKALIIFLSVGLILCGSLITAMLYTAHGKGYDPARPPKTVLVLGCQVRGTEPSLMLTRRLEAAYQYLTQYPDAVCVVSGGQGDDEDIPEGEAMEQYPRKISCIPRR